MADSIGGAGPAPGGEYVDHNAWVAWQYDPAEWAAFDEQEMAWVQYASRRRFQAAGILAVAEIALLSIAVLRAGWAVVPLACVVGIVIVAVGGIEHRLRLGRVLQRRQARAAGSCQIRIGARGLVEAGCYTPLVESDLRPRAVQIRAGAPMSWSLRWTGGKGAGGAVSCCACPFRAGARRRPRRWSTALPPRSSPPMICAGDGSAVSRARCACPKTCPPVPWRTNSPPHSACLPAHPRTG